MTGGARTGGGGFSQEDGVREMRWREDQVQKGEQPKGVSDVGGTIEIGPQGRRRYLRLPSRPRP